MEKGDVFRAAEKDFMYIAEAVAPSGTVYARKFDLYYGAYGEPEAFQSNAEFKILFNTFKPEKHEGWEYCEIVHAVEWADGKEWFEAKALNVENKGRISHAPVQRFIRGETRLDMEEDRSKKTHQKLVDKLLADGWEEVIERRTRWFHLRLKRKKGSQVQKKSKG